MSINLDRHALSIPIDTIAKVYPVSSGSPQSDPGTGSQDTLSQSGYTVYLINPK